VPNEAIHHNPFLEQLRSNIVYGEVRCEVNPFVHDESPSLHSAVKHFGEIYSDYWPFTYRPGLLRLNNLDHAAFAEELAGVLNSFAIDKMPKKAGPQERSTAKQFVAELIQPDWDAAQIGTTHESKIDIYAYTAVIARPSRKDWCALIFSNND